MLDSLCYMLLHVLWRLYVVVNVRGLFLVLSRVLLLSVVLVVHTCLESRYFEFGQSSVRFSLCLNMTIIMNVRTAFSTFLYVPRVAVTFLEWRSRSQNGGRY